MLVKISVECIAILLEVPSDWESCRKIVLADASLLSKMKNLNCEKIKAEVIAKIKKRINANPNFIPSEVKAISVAAKSICEWVHAVSNFYDVFQEITKKRQYCK